MQTRFRPVAALRERIPSFLRGALLTPRERAALAIALLAFLLVAARRCRGWL